jgi:hypothetical protein
MLVLEFVKIQTICAWQWHVFRPKQIHVVLTISPTTKYECAVLFSKRPVTIVYTAECLHLYWPIGEQNWTFVFGSWTYSQDDMDLFGPKNMPLPCTDCLDLDEFQNKHIEIKSTSITKEVKKYDCCPENYVSLHVNIVFKHKARFEHGKLECSRQPNTKVFTYCNGANDCPCGMNVCHPLAISTLEGDAICIPGATKCTFDADCTKVGDAHGGGELMVKCENKRCEYDRAIVMA